MTLDENCKEIAKDAIKDSGKTVNGYDEKDKVLV